MPQIRTFSVFLYEILINKKLEWFYTIAVILLIPVMFSMLRQLWWDISEFEMNYLQENWLLVEKENGTEKEQLSKLTPEVSDEIYLAVFDFFIIYYQITCISTELFKISIAYDYIATLVVRILLMLSFLFWLLSVCGII